MSNIENQVVQLEFDNAEFSRRLEETLAGLDQLAASLNFSGVDTGFDSIAGGLDSVDFSGLADGIDNISSKFTAMGAVGFTVLQDITRAALSAGKAMLDATVGQVLSGGKQRSLAIEQAKFQFEGLGQDVEKSMQSALDAVRGTAYGLDEAATVAASFGASGIAAGDDMTQALRGVAGVAALTGTSFGEMGSIFQDVAGAGKLTGAHLFSFASRGINMAANLSKEFGVTEEAVREMATNGEISFEKFASAVDGAFGEHAQSANKTYAGSLANLRAALSRVGATFFDVANPALRDIFNSTTLAIDNMAGALGPVIALFKFFVEDVKNFAIEKLWSIDFAAIGNVISNITVPIFNGFKTMGYSIGRVLGTIGGAFTDIFGKVDVGGTIERLVAGFTKLTDAMVPSADTLDKIKSVASGVFAALSIVWEVIKGVAGVFRDLFSAMAPVRSGTSDIAAGFGDALVKLKEFLVDGGKIADFFDDLGGSLSKLVSGGLSKVGDILSSLGDVFSRLFDGLGKGAEKVDKFDDRVKDTGSTISNFASKFRGIFEGLRSFISSIFSYFGDAFSGLGESIGSSLEKGNFNEILDVLNVGALVAIGVGFKKFTDAISEGVSVNLGSWEDAMESFGDTLGALQGKLKSEALLNIAKAVGILTISIVALSFIDSASLTKAMVSIAGGFGLLIGAFALLNKVVLDPKTASQMVAISIALGFLAGAMLVLSVPVMLLSTLDWDELAKGLLGLAGMLGIVVLAVKPLASSSKGLFTASIGLGALGVALVIVAGAVKLMSMLSWEEMAKGLTGVGVALGGLVLATRFINPKQLFSSGVGLAILSVGLLAIAGAVRLMADLEWGEIAKGLVAVGATLAGLVLASNFAQSAIGGAISIGIMAGSMMLLAASMKVLGQLEWGEIGKGLAVMAASLLLFVLAAYAIGSGPALIGLIGLAATLPAISAGLLIFGDAIKKMASISWGDFAKGLGMIAIGLVVVGLAAYALLASGATLAILALGGTLAVVGVAMLAFGAGVFLLAKGLEALANAGEAGLDFYVEYLKTIITLIPTLLTELAEGVIAFFDTLFDAAPELLEGLITILGDLLDGLVELSPKFQEAMTVLLTDLAETIIETSPILAEAIFTMLMSMLEQIDLNMPLVIERGGSIVVNFLQGIADNMGDIVTAGIDIIVNFLNGIADNIGQIVAAAVNIVVQFLGGIQSQIGIVIQKGVDIIMAVVDGVADAIPELVDKGAKAIVRMLNGMATAIDENKQDAIDAFKNLAGALIGALKDAALDLIPAAFRSIGGAIADAAGGLVDGLNPANWGGPAHVFEKLGVDLSKAVGDGIKSGTPYAVVRAEGLYDGVLSTFNARTFAELENMDGFNPTITPVLDLSQVREQSQGINDILGRQTAIADSTLSQADLLLRESDSGSNGQGAADETPRTLTFEQNNYSPEALSTGKIYKMTKGQIEMAKEEFDL